MGKPTLEQRVAQICDRLMPDDLLSHSATIDGWELTVRHMYDRIEVCMRECGALGGPVIRAVHRFEQVNGAWQPFTEGTDSTHLLQWVELAESAFTTEDASVGKNIPWHDMLRRETTASSRSTSPEPNAAGAFTVSPSAA